MLECTHKEHGELRNTKQKTKAKIEAKEDNLQHSCLDYRLGFSDPIIYTNVWRMMAVRLWSVRQRVRLSHLLCWDNTDQDTKDDVMLWLHVDYELWVVSLSCRFRLLTLALNNSFRGTLYERGALLSFIFSYICRGFSSCSFSLELLYDAATYISSDLHAL